jgi:transposase
VASVEVKLGATALMEERLRLVARLLDGEAMTDVCREFGVSRKTGYKIFDRYREHGLEALSDARGGRYAMPTSCRRRSRA